MKAASGSLQKKSNAAEGNPKRELRRKKRRKPTAETGKREVPASGQKPGGAPFSHRSLGALKEQLAAGYLAERGYKIIEKNFYSRSGEIDLIAHEGGYLVFIEVKYRSSRRFGRPEEAVTPAKQRSIIRTAKYYLRRQGFSENTPCRFDVLAIDGEELHLIPNAFTL